MAVARCVHLGFYVPCIMALLTFARSSSEFPNVPLPLDQENARSSIAPDMLLDVYLSLADAAQKLEFLIQGSNAARQPGRKKRQNNGSSDKRYDMNTWEFMRFGK